MNFIQKLGEVSLIAGETYDRKNEKKTSIFLHKHVKKSISDENISKIVKYKFVDAISEAKKRLLLSKAV
ncbi:hypothetical protein BOQ62_09475 [Chryseobacterium sp. CH21]|nr:hypothetical protein BOQ62_09475 [Chryseobacterium sp. CH21]